MQNTILNADDQERSFLGLSVWPNLNTKFLCYNLQNQLKIIACGLYTTMILTFTFWFTSCTVDINFFLQVFYIYMFYFFDDSFKRIKKSRRSYIYKCIELYSWVSLSCIKFICIYSSYIVSMNKKIKLFESTTHFFRFTLY